jgi:hypothetical protein
MAKSLIGTDTSRTRAKHIVEQDVISLMAIAGLDMAKKSYSSSFSELIFGKCHTRCRLHIDLQLTAAF